MENIRNVRRSGNSLSVVIPSWYWKKVDFDTGKNVIAFKYQVGENNELKLEPIFEKKRKK
jgi:antitoxin component of MazEF toxin-antitoxin module